jgi:hypothetical protein
MTSAPRDGSLFLAWAPADHGLPAMHSLCAWHPDAGFCVDELREPTHWMPLPAPPDPGNDDTTFLDVFLQRVEAGEPVTLEEVARLKRLADWADVPPPPGWMGRANLEETRRAVADARKHMTSSVQEPTPV